MEQVRRYTFKLYPNKTQEKELEKQCLLLKDLWNGALQEREDHYKKEVQNKGHWHKLKRDKEDKPQHLSYFDQSKHIKFIRKDNPEYADMSCASLELCLKALDLAFKAFYRKLKEGMPYYQAGYPKYKSAKKHKTIWHRDGSGWKLEKFNNHWKFYFKGISGKIKARGKFPIQPNEIRTMEIIYRDNAWQASVVVKQDARITAGKHSLIIDFDLLDKFVCVKNKGNGRCPPGLLGDFLSLNGRIINQNQVDDNLSGSDTSILSGNGKWRGGIVNDEIQSIGDKRYKKFSYRWKKEKKRLARRKAKEARIRSYNLHAWTTWIINNASDITIIAPKIKENTKSAKGNEDNWGAAVEPVAKLNRNTLEMAPAMVIQMLEYKCEEAGIKFEKIENTETKLNIGKDLPTATKAARKARKKVNKFKEIAA